MVAEDKLRVFRRPFSNRILEKAKQFLLYPLITKSYYQKPNSMKKFLLIYLSILAGLAPSFGQTTLHVPGTYPTIQAAVNASTHPLDVVQVAAGTYSGAVNISKSLSIHGPNLGIAGSGARGLEAIISNANITISGSPTVTIDGIKVFQTNNSGDAVLLGGSSVVTFRNCIVERNGITPGAIVRGLTVAAGPGLKTIQDNLFTGDISGGLFNAHKTWNSGIYLLAMASTCEIKNNVFNNCRTAINIDDFNSGILISGNEFDNNGTFISFGGVVPTEGQYTLPANTFKNPAAAIINLSNVHPNFRLDITSSTFNGIPFPSYSLSDLFQWEQLMFHRGRAGRKGLVTYVPNRQYVVQVNPSIQTAINYGEDGQTIHIAPGTFTENLNLNKKINLIGSGSGADATANTHLNQTAAGAGETGLGVIQLATSGVNGNPVMLKDMRILPMGMAGISVGKFNQTTQTNVAHIAMENIHIEGSNHADPCTEQERGLYVDPTSSLSNLSIVNCAFNALDYGWYLHKAVSADMSTVANISVLSTVFQDNISKGLYAEKLDNATFNGCTVVNNGDATWTGNSCNQFKPFLSGMDINLKAGSYQNITIRNSVFSGNGTGEAKEGAALVIKARNDAPSYSIFPASLNNVLVENNIITGNERGIRIGEPGKNNAGPTNVIIQNNALYDNMKTYAGNDGSAYGNIINLTSAPATATCNWYGTNIPASVAAGVSGLVTFIPFLQDGNDGNTNIGFQPTALCESPAVCSFTAVCFQQGLTHGGQPVPANRSDPKKAEVAQKNDVAGTINFYSLGFGGYITLKSSCAVKNGDGNDIKVWETTYGAQPINTFSDRARVYASQDGVNFIYLGMATYDGSFDLQTAGLNWAQYFRIVDATVDAPSNPANADAFDVDGIEVLNGYTNDLPPAIIVTGSAASVCGGTQGKTKAFGGISPIRSDPTAATGTPQNNDTYNFYALGFGGDICLKFDFAIFDGPGGELTLFETTFGNTSCNNYKEQAEVSVSYDGLSWVVLGTYCQDFNGTIDITPVNSGIQYIRFRDVSERSDFSSPFADGYDVDGVVAVSSITGTPPCHPLSQGRMAVPAFLGYDQTEVPDEIEPLHLVGNPGQNQVQLQFSMVSPVANLTVVNSMGQRIVSESITGNLWELKTMDISVDLSPGVYFITLNSGVQKETISLLKE